jgi:hypothetical protein
VLGEWQKEGLISASEVDEIAQQMLHKNAASIYGIEI